MVKVYVWIRAVRVWIWVRISVFERMHTKWTPKISVQYG